MRFDRLTSHLQSAMADAQSMAVGRDHNAIEPTHLLAAMLNQEGGSVRPMLEQAGFNMAGLQQDLQHQIQLLPVVQSPTGEVNLSQNLGRLFNLADKQAQQQGDQYISSESLLLAMLDDSGDVGKTLRKHGDKARLQKVWVWWFRNQVFGKNLISTHTFYR